MLGKLTVAVAVVLHVGAIFSSSKVRPWADRKTGASVGATVEPLIQSMRERFAETPMVRHLLSMNDAQEVSQTNNFLPYLTFFVNSFSDLNRFVLPYADPQDDKIKNIINEHCKEDSDHMLLLWKDLEEYNGSMQQAGVENFSSAARFLWSDDLMATRKVGYELARMLGESNEDPLIRYAMIRVMEEVGNVFFTASLGYKMPNGTPSYYMSHDHLDRENGHLQAESEDSQHGGLESYFEGVFFKDEQQQEMMVRVMHHTYQLFEDMLRDVHNGMETAVIKMARMDEKTSISSS